MGHRTKLKNILTRWVVQELLLGGPFVPTNCAYLHAQKGIGVDLDHSPMAHRSARQAGEKIQLARWFYWQILRRSPKYRLAVAEFLKSVREHRRRLIRTIEAWNRRHSRFSTEKRLEAWGKGGNQRDLLQACERVLETYRVIRRPTPLDKTGNPVLQAIGQCIRECVTFDRSEHRPPGLVRRLPDKPRILLPELDSFSRKWGVKFPLPPSLEQTIEGAFTTAAGRFHPVRIQHDASELTLQIRLCLPKELLRALVDGALHHFMPHTREWRTISRKAPRNVSAFKESVKISRSKKMVQVRMKLENSLLPFDKEALLRLIGAQIPGSSALRLRKDEAHEMFRVADSLRLNRRGRGPKETRSKVAKRAFPRNAQVYLVQKRESRFLHLRAALSL